MIVDFQEQTVNYLRETALEAFYQEEVTEYQLQESMPQIEQIITCSGAVFMKSKQISGGKITVCGQVKACVLYRAAENSDLQTLEKELEFTVKKDLPADESEQFVFYRGWIKRLDVKLLNERKLLLRVNIGSSFKVYTAASVNISMPAEPPKALQMLSNTYEMMLPSYAGETEFRLNEESVLPETAAGISKILKATANCRVTESKTVGDKAVFKGDVLLHVLYEASSGSLHCFDTEIPFSQFADLNGEAENGEVRMCMQPLSFEIDTDGQEDSKRLIVGFHALAQAVVYEKKQVTLIEDAYTTRGCLDAQWQEFSLPAALDSQSIPVSGELSVAASADRVVDALVYTDHPIIRRDGDRVKVVMPVHAAVLFFDRDGKLQSKVVKNEISCDTSASSDASLIAYGAIYEQPVCLASYDTVTLRLTAQMRLDSYMGSKLHTLNKAQIDPQASKQPCRPSLIARRAGSESVWEIAKSCGSTVDAICEANALSGGIVQEGAILLIPMQ